MNNDSSSSDDNSQFETPKGSISESISEDNDQQYPEAQPAAQVVKSLTKNAAVSQTNCSGTVSSGATAPIAHAAVIHSTEQPEESETITQQHEPTEKVKSKTKSTAISGKKVTNKQGPSTGDPVATRTRLASTTSTQNKHVCKTSHMDKFRRLKDLSRNEIVEMAKHAKINHDVPDEQLRTKIDNFYRQNHTNWPRNAKGQLLFGETLEIAKPTRIDKLMKKEIEKIAKFIGLPTSTIFIKKADLIDKVSKHILETVPDAKICKKSGFLVISQELIKNIKKSSI